MSNTKTAKLLLTPIEVGIALNIGRTTVHALIADGSLRSVRIGRALRVPVTEVYRFIEEGGTAA